MKISVKILFGEERPFEVSSEMSVFELKAMVTEQCNIPQAKQKLLLNGRALVDNKKLSEYDIQEGTKLNVFVCQPKSAASNELPEENPPEEDLYSLLLEKLKMHWNDEDARKVADEFMRSMHENLETMSMDDIERMATELLIEEEEAVAETGVQDVHLANGSMSDAEADQHQENTVQESAKEDEEIAADITDK